MDVRRSGLFVATSILRAVRGGRRACRCRHKQATTTPKVRARPLPAHGTVKANARRFLRDLERAAPMKITRVLTGSGHAFTDRLPGLRKHGPPDSTTSICSAPSAASSTASRPHAAADKRQGRAVQRARRGRPAEPSRTFRRGPGADDPALRSPLQQPAVKGRTPFDALQDRQRQKPELFRKRVSTHAGCDTVCPATGSAACGFETT